MSEFDGDDRAGVQRRGAMSLMAAGIAAAVGPALAWASNNSLQGAGEGSTGMDTSRLDPMGSGLPIEADIMLREAPPPPFDWVREGTSFWMFEENGDFGFPRVGVEAEPWSWDNRFLQNNLVFAGGRQLIRLDRAPAPPILDENGNPMIMGCGALTFRCIEPFRRWLVTYDGDAVEGHVSEQLAGNVSVTEQFAETFDKKRLVPLKYEFHIIGIFIVC